MTCLADGTSNAQIGERADEAGHVVLLWLMRKLLLLLLTIQKVILCAGWFAETVHQIVGSRAEF